MRKRVILFALALLALLTGCKSKITSGEVTERKFTPAHTAVMTIPVVYSDGKTCRTRYQPFFYYYPDSYYITISVLDEDGVEQTATYRVTKDVYDATTLGAEFIYDKTMEPQEPEYERESLEWGEG